MNTYINHIIFYCRWFDGFNWEGLRLRNLQQPITPKIQGHLDTSNFDDYPMDADGPPPGYFYINFKLHNKVYLTFHKRVDRVANILQSFSHVSDDVSGWDEAF